jgi:hypothetical protein
MKNYRKVNNTMFSICPHCNEKSYVNPYEYKYFDCDKCGSSAKYVKMEWETKELCTFCKWGRRSYMSEETNICYSKSKNTIKFDTDGYDSDDTKFEKIDCDHCVCDDFETFTIGELVDNDYIINKSTENIGYYGFWMGLNSYLFDKNDIDVLPDCSIIINELDTGNKYKLSKSEFLKNALLKDSDYYLDIEKWEKL